MRCPNCDQWNRSTLPRCSRCGTELNSSAPVEPSWRAHLKRSSKAYIRVDEDGLADVSPDRRDELAQQMTDLKTRMDDGLLRQQQLMTQTGPLPPLSQDAPEREIPLGEDASEEAAASAEEAPPEESPASPFPPAQPRRSARVAVHGLPGSMTGPHQTAQAQQSSSSEWYLNRSRDLLVEQMQREQPYSELPPVPAQPLRTRSRHRSTRMIVNWITTILVIIVAGLACAVGFSAYQNYLEMRAKETQAYVTASMKDDLAAHTVLIPGQDGQMIHIRELHRSFEVVGGFATIVIPDHEWYDELDVVTEEVMSVTLTPSIQTSGGRQKTLDPITYDIAIPLSPIELVSPDRERLEVMTAMYSIKFRVREGSIVHINGVDMSDAVDDNGYLVYNATVQPKGDNIYTINVRSPYCRDNSMSVTLFRQVQEIPLDLAATTYTSTSLNKYEITCTTLPGAEVDILSPHSDLIITKLNTTGEFSFIALFDKIGMNKVVIQATYPGKKTSLVEYEIYYLPSPDIYTRKAWSLTNSADYAELMGNISFRAENTQIYVAIGTIDSFRSESPQLAVMYCSEDGTSQPVLLENQTKTVWEKGKRYRIYADVYGTYDGMPWLIARYTYAD